MCYMASRGMTLFPEGCPKMKANCRHFFFVEKGSRFGVHEECPTTCLASLADVDTSPCSPVVLLL